MHGGQPGMPDTGEQGRLAAQGGERARTRRLPRGLEHFDGELRSTGPGVLRPARPVHRGDGAATEFLRQQEASDGADLQTSHLHGLGPSRTRV